MNLDINKLNFREKEIVFSLSIIPFSMFSIPELREMFQVNDDEQFLFFDTVHDLSLKGFLSRQKAFYGLPANIARSILEKGKPTFEDCSALINYLSSCLEKEKPDFELEFTPVYKKLEYLFQKISGKSFHLAQLSYLLSSNLVRFKKFEEALKYNQLAVDISESIDRRHPSIAIYYRNKALIHKKLGDSEMSIYYSLKDIEILELNAGRYDDLLPGSYFNLSKTYEDLHNYEKAIEYNLKAIQVEKKRKPQRFINLSGLYHNLAYYYMKLNNLHDASKFIDKAVESYSMGKNTNNEQFKTLLRDQKRFKSLFRFEQFVIKYKYPILIFLIIILLLIVWGILELFI
jgi:tetratricopeptide (TPR) repeat protein